MAGINRIHRVMRMIRDLKWNIGFFCSRIGYLHMQDRPQNTLTSDQRSAVRFSLLLIVTTCVLLCFDAIAGYPVQRPPREEPAPESGQYTIYPGQKQQVVWGLGFEIQSDSIGSGNNGLPEAHTSVPHDLTPSERKRFAKEMLTGFRFCRLAGGLYWRGTDAEGKHLKARWPEQLEEIRQMMEDGGVESLSF